VTGKGAVKQDSSDLPPTLVKVEDDHYVGCFDLGAATGPVA
jgi:hypothetical protein